MRDRFDRAYAARRKADHSIPLGRGLWLSLYNEEATDPVTKIGAGAGLVHPPVARVPLGEAEMSSGGKPPVASPRSPSGASDDDSFEPLTIPQAKVRLARTLGVPESSVRITIEA